MGHFLERVVTDDNGDPLANAVGQIFDIEDTNNAAPLPLFNLNGTPIALDQLWSNNDGITPEFTTPLKKAVKWVSGIYEVGLIAADLLPQGGMAGQILSKTTDQDHDVNWADPLGVAPGGTDGQVLIKDGSTDYATRWGDVTGGTGGTGGTTLTAGMVGFVRQNADGTWPTRPTSLSSVLVIWVGLSTWPAIVASGVNGPHSGDIFLEKRVL